MTEPMTPPECDLRGFEFMPLMGDRLFKSATWIAASSEAKVAMLRLWWHSYAHEAPAASLPDNDQLLAEYAGYGVMVKGWLKIKEQAIRGFVLCTDGRLYHPIVAELALAGWKERLRNREKQRAYRERTSVKDGDVTVTKTGSKVGTKPRRNARQGEGQREGQGQVIPPDGGGAASDAPTTRGTRLPKTWTMTASGKAFIAKERPDLNAAVVEQMFRDHWHGKPGKDGVKLDWEGTWRNWVRNQRALPSSAPGMSADWWDSKGGVLAKGKELQLAPADDSHRAWFLFMASVWVAMGDGPWWDKNSAAYPIAVRMQDEKALESEGAT